MAVSLYCKKCKMDVPVGDVCPHCGGKLSASTSHLSWCVNHRPVLDWFSWNRIMRLVIPVFLVVIFLSFLMEMIASGWQGLESMLRDGYFRILGSFFFWIFVVCALVFTLQGTDVQDITIDNKGAHITSYLASPTKLKLIARLRSAKLLQEARAEGEEVMPKLSEQSVSWSDVRRVQLWPEKSTILLYSPRWLMRMAISCTPYSYEDTLQLIRDKLGKKKNVILPSSLRVETTSKGKKSSKGTKTRGTDIAPAEMTPEFLEKIKEMNAMDEREAKDRA